MDSTRDLFEGQIDAAWQVRHSARARRLAIRVFPEGRVEIIVPRGASTALVHAFVLRHRGWVERKLADRRGEASVSLETFPPTAVTLAAFGEIWHIQQTNRRSRARIFVREGCVLEVPQSLTGDILRTALLRWLCEHVRVGFADRLDALAKEFGLRPATLQIRRQRTRWGSCSRKGAISLNVCGVFQRPEVLRYLMLHELAHLRHMNHSAAYWGEVQSMCPQWKVLDRELTQGWRHVPRWVFAV